MARLLHTVFIINSLLLFNITFYLIKTVTYISFIYIYIYKTIYYFYFLSTLLLNMYRFGE